MLNVMKRRKVDAIGSASSSSSPLHRLPTHHHLHHQPTHPIHPTQQLYDASAVPSYASLQQQLHRQQFSLHPEHHHHARRLLASAHYAEAHGSHFQQQQQLFRPVTSTVTNGAASSPVVRADATVPRTESPQSLPGISSVLRRPTSSASVGAAPVITPASRVAVSSAAAPVAVLPPPRSRSGSVSSTGNASSGMVLSPADMFAASAARSSSSSSTPITVISQLPPPSLPERWTPETGSISPIKSVSPLRLAPPLAATGSSFFATTTADRQPHSHHQYQTRGCHTGKRPAPPSAPAIDLAPVRSPSLRHSIGSLEDFKSFSSAGSSAASTPRDVDDLVPLSTGFIAAAIPGAADSIDSDSMFTTRTTRAASEERIANPNKNSRYLREMDRREILSRIEQGEKQATLAKEYQVSRAAICNLNKHRDEVMSRKDENPLAKHPKKPRPKTFKIKIRASKSKAKKLPSPSGARGSSAGSSGGAGGGKAANIHEVKSRAAALLLTSVRNKNTHISEFRRCSERLLRLVLEDALALVPIKAVEVYLSDLVKADGVGWEHPPCAISMEQRETCGSPLLDLFRAIEPDQPSARANVDVEREMVTDDSSYDADSLMLSSSSRAELTDTGSLPPSLKYHNVFVFDISATSSNAICSVLQKLQERGAVEAMISIVVVFITTETILAVRSRYPCVKIVAAQIDPSGKRPPSPPAALAGVDGVNNGQGSPGSSEADPPPCCLDFVIERFRQVYA